MNYGRKFRLLFVMLLLAYSLVLLSAQESLPPLPDTSYLLSESDKTKLLQAFQLLADKLKRATQNLQASEQALQDLKNQSLITEQQYKISQEKLAALETAYQQLTSELELLKQEKATLLSDYQNLQTALANLENKYQALEQASNQLKQDYQALQEAYKMQTESFNTLNQSFKDYQKSVQALKNKSLILEIIIAGLAAGWALDILGVF